MFGIGDLVKESSHIYDRLDQPDPINIGLIVDWQQDGWIVEFRGHGKHWMPFESLELVNEAR